MTHGDTTSELRRVLAAAQSERNEATFKSLYDLIANDVFLYVDSRTPTREDALDTTQGVLVDLWVALPKFTYRGDAQFYGFIFTIAKRRIAKFYRSQTKASRIRASDYCEPIATISTEHIQSAELVHTALKVLRDKDKEVLILRYWLQRSFKEIGETLKISEQNARIRHHRALIKLEKSLPNHAN